MTQNIGRMVLELERRLRERERSFHSLHDEMSRSFGRLHEQTHLRSTLVHAIIHLFTEHERDAIAYHSLSDRVSSEHVGSELSLDRLLLGCERIMHSLNQLWCLYLERSPSRLPSATVPVLADTPYVEDLHARALVRLTRRTYLASETDESY